LNVRGLKKQNFTLLHCKKEMILNRKLLKLLWIGLGLFIAAFAWDAYFSGDGNMRRYKASIESYLHATEQRADAVMNDQEFIGRRLMDSRLGNRYEQDLKKTELLRTEIFNFCIFKDDSLVFWSRNDVLPLWSDFSDTIRNKTITKCVTLRESNYELRYRNEFDRYKNKVIIATLIPLKNAYSTLEGEYLESHFPASGSIPAELNLVESKGLFPVMTSDSKILCYLDNNETYADLTHDIGVFLLLFFGFFLLGIFGDKIAKQMLAQYQSPLSGVLFFFSCMALMRIIVLWIQKSELLPFLDLGMGDFYDAVFVKSLAELMIDTGFLFWFAIFFNAQFKLQDYGGQPLWKRLSLGAAFYSVIVLLMILCIGIVNDLVLNWNHLLAFDNLSDFNIQSITALLGIGIILLSIFLLSHRLISTLNELLVTNFEHFIAVDVAVGIGILLFENYELSLPTWMYVIFIFVYIGLFHQFIRYKRPGLIWLVQWVIIFSAIIAFFISRFNLQKDRKTLEDFSYTLANEQDIIAEKRIQFLTAGIEKDPTIQTLSIFPIRLEIDPRRIAERISLKFNNDEYLSNHYSFRYVTHYQNGEALIQSDSVNLHSLMQKRETGKTLDTSNHVTFWTDKKGQFAYLAVAKVPVMPNNPIYVEMEFKREDKLSSRVFTELFTDKNYKGLPRLNDFSYAIYKNGECKEQNQTGLYSHFLNKKDLPVDGESLKFTANGNRDELTYRSPEGVVVKIGKERAISSRGIALGMYLVLILSFLLLILSALNHYVKFLPDIVQFPFSFSFNSSLRNRILFPSISFILVSYVAIFIFTVRYFKNVDERYYNTELENKSDFLVSSAVMEIKEMHDYNIDTSSNISKMLMNYSERYQTALHIFDTEGYLVATTEKNIFDKDKGITSKRMNPVAFMRLKSGEKIMKSDEQIGKFHYRSAYYAVEDNQGKQFAFLELPFYSRDRKQRVDVSETWTYNATILTMLLVLGICIIYIRTSKNIEPIQHIADQLSRLRLGKKERNEPIPWDKKDEIGVLIEAYNNKVAELEDTYGRLGEAEREGAWRDMAKQVAHEVRNPLTPMKLIVQHLEMMRLQKNDNLEEYLIRSNKVLLDQIDSLEKIVSEFASFARIPQKANNEMFVFNDLVSSVANLFSQPDDDKEIEFFLNIPEERYTVYADRSLLVNALNNLVKNAIQAISHDRKGRVSVSLYRRNSLAVVRISDNGSGIPKDIQDKIFTPNFTTKAYGSGIGLLITKNIIQSVNGKIYFETVENEGTDFFIELEIQEIEEPHNVEKENSSAN
jgi:two-component system, NtrC family, nitrogen regulation sensor histidine kinase NtrY